MRAAKFVLVAGLLLAGAGVHATAGVRSAAPAPEAADPAKIVTEFYNLVFLDHKVKEGFARFVGPVYRQHNPRVADGPAATIAYLEKRFAENPQARNEIIRSFVNGDLVALHVHSTLGPQDRGKAIVDIFRVKDGRIVEHWDVIQDIPEPSANDNGMF